MPSFREFRVWGRDSKRRETEGKCYIGETICLEGWLYDDKNEPMANEEIEIEVEKHKGVIHPKKEWSVTTNEKGKFSLTLSTGENTFFDKVTRYDFRVYYVTAWPKYIEAKETLWIVKRPTYLEFTQEPLKYMDPEHYVWITLYLKDAIDESPLQNVSVTIKRVRPYDYEDVDKEEEWSRVIWSYREATDSEGKVRFIFTSTEPYGKNKLCWELTEGWSGLDIYEQPYLVYRGKRLEEDYIIVTIGIETKLELRTYELEDIEQFYAWGTYLRPKAILTKEGEPYPNQVVHFSVYRPKEGVETPTEDEKDWELERTYTALTDSKGIATTPYTERIENPKTLKYRAVKVEYEGTLPVLNSKDFKWWTIDKRETDLVIGTPWKDPSGNWHREEEEVKDTIPAGSTLEVSIKLIDAISKNPLGEGYDIVIRTMLPRQDEFVEVGTFKTNISGIVTYSLAMPVKGTYWIEAESKETDDYKASPPRRRSKTAGKSLCKFIYVGDTGDALVGEEFRLAWKLVDHFDENKTIEGVPVVLRYTSETGVLKTEFEEQVTDSEGVVSWTWKPLLEETGEYKFYLEWKERYENDFYEAPGCYYKKDESGTGYATDEEGNYILVEDDRGTTTIKVPKEPSYLTLDGSTSLTIEKEEKYSGTLTTRGDKGIENAVVEVYLDATDEEVLNKEESKLFATVYTDEKGEYSFVWTPKLEEVGTHTLKAYYRGDSYEPSNICTLEVVVEMKESSIEWDISDTTPVPSCKMWVEGYLLEREMAPVVERSGQKIELEIRRGEWSKKYSTTTKSGYQAGYFKIEFTSPSEEGTYEAIVRWEGSTEYGWKPTDDSKHTIVFTVEKETPRLVLAVPDTVIDSKKFRVSGALISYHGATLKGLKLTLSKDGESVSKTIEDESGIVSIEREESVGTYTYTLSFEGSYQLKSTETSRTFYVIPEPDYTRPVYEIRVYDRKEGEKSISPLERVIEFNIERSIASEADAFTIALDNKDLYYYDRESGESKVKRGDLVVLRTGYMPKSGTLDWSKLPVALGGVVEETSMKFTSRGRVLTVKGQDYTLYLKSVVVDESYTKKSPYYILAEGLDKKVTRDREPPSSPSVGDYWKDLSQTPAKWYKWNGSEWVESLPSIFIVAEVEDLFDFNIIAPSGYPYRKTLSFDNKSLLECLKRVRTECNELRAGKEEYEFFIKSEDLATKKQVFVFRPKLASQLSCESLEMGKNILEFNLVEDNSVVRNKVRVLGAYVPVETTESFKWTPMGEHGELGKTFYLEHGRIVNIASLTIGGQIAEEGVTEGKASYEVDYELGQIRLNEEPSEGTLIEVKYTYRERLLPEGGELAGIDYEKGWWTDSSSRDSYTLGKYRTLVIETNLESREELDSLSETLLKSLNKPLKAKQLRTRGLFLTNPGDEILFKYDAMNIEERNKVVKLSHSMSKRGGFVTSVTLEELVPELGDIIANKIGEEIWFRVL